MNNLTGCDKGRKRLRALSPKQKTEDSPSTPQSDDGKKKKGRRSRSSSPNQTDTDTSSSSSTTTTWCCPKHPSARCMPIVIVATQHMLCSDCFIDLVRPTAAAALPTMDPPQLLYTVERESSLYGSPHPSLHIIDDEFSDDLLSPTSSSSSLDQLTPPDCIEIVERFNTQFKQIVSEQYLSEEDFKALHSDILLILNITRSTAFQDEHVSALLNQTLVNIRHCLIFIDRTPSIPDTIKSDMASSLAAVSHVSPPPSR